MKPIDFFHLEGTGKIPTIFQHTDEQLETAIKTAVDRHPDFYILLHGIDAYMERRRRRMRAARSRQMERINRRVDEMEALDGMWGNS